MELIEFLVVFNLLSNFILFLVMLYAIAKITVLSRMKTPQQIAEEILKTKVPVFVDPDGIPMMQPDMEGATIQNNNNPIVG